MAYRPDQTEHEEWIDKAADLSKVIIQDADLTGDFKDVEKEAMRDLMEKVRELDYHLRSDFPDICKCEDNECLGWRMGYNQAKADSGV